MENKKEYPYSLIVVFNFINGTEVKFVNGKSSIFDVSDMELSHRKTFAEREIRELIASSDYLKMKIEEEESKQTLVYGDVKGVYTEYQLFAYVHDDKIFPALKWQCFSTTAFL